MNWVGEAYLAAVLHRDKLYRPAELSDTPRLEWFSRLLSALREAVALKYCTYRAIPVQACLT